jgi:hypothetical protein
LAVSNEFSEKGGQCKAGKETEEKIEGKKTEGEKKRKKKKEASSSSFGALKLRRPPNLSPFSKFDTIVRPPMYNGEMDETIVDVVFVSPLEMEATKSFDGQIIVFVGDMSGWQHSSSQEGRLHACTQAEALGGYVKRGGSMIIDEETTMVVIGPRLKYQSVNNFLVANNQKRGRRGEFLTDVGRYFLLFNCDETNGFYICYFWLDDFYF